MNMRVKSFSERALLNSTVLDIICPTNCEKNRIRQINDSVIETLFHSKKDLYSNKVKTGLLHKSTKPIKAVMRVLYFQTVLLVVAPLGMICNGAITIIKLSVYCIKKCAKTATKEEWQKIKEYAKAFFKDFSCLFVGATLAAVCILPVTWIAYSAALGTFALLSVTDKVVSLVFITPFSLWSAHFLGAYQPSAIIARLVGTDETKTSIYLALEARNQLGLVNENGKLLSFSQKDALKPTITSIGTTKNFFFNDKASCNFQLILAEAELDLLECAREAKYWLKENNKKNIRYAYPFNGDIVAKQLESEFGTDNEKITALISKLKSLQLKITAFKNFYHTAQEITIKPSIAGAICKFFAEKSADIQTKKIPCTILNDYYMQFFNLPFIPPQQKQYDSLKKLYESIKLTSIEPTTPPLFQTDSYDKFKYVLLTEKWKSENGRSLLNPQQIFELPENYSDRDKKNMFRALSLALHPDKNKHREEEATILYQSFQQIYAMLNKNN